MVASVERILVLGVVVLGIFLRFYDLDKKVYWYDEAFTSLEVSGYTPQEAAADILTGRIVSSSELEKYQFTRAESAKSTADTIKGIIANEPQLTPAYFVALRWWSYLFPYSISAVRALSAIFSVLALGTAFWLCRELFPTLPRVAYFCAALIALSPYHLLYAQEARPYTMWLAAVLFLSVLLIKAIRHNRIRAWILYTLTAALSLYIFLFSILVISWQALYVAVINNFKIARATKAFAISALTAILSFLFWPYRGEHSGAGNDHFSAIQYAWKWSRSVAVLFADFNLSPDSPKAVLVPYSILLSALLTLCAYSIYFVCRRANRQQTLFVVQMTTALCLPLMMLDVLRGSSLATVTRYSFPSFVGLQIVVAYTLASKTDRSERRIVRVAWQLATACVLGVELVSSVMVARADTWWNKAPDNYILAASRLINAAQDPVIVVSDSWFVFILSLEHKLRPNVRYQLTVQPDLPVVDLGGGAGPESIFAVKPSSHLRAGLSNCFKFEPVEGLSEVWTLERIAASCSGSK